MTEQNSWSLTQLDFEVLLSLNSDLYYSVPIQGDLSVYKNEIILNSINRLVKENVILLDVESKEIQTSSDVRASLENIGNATRIVKLFSSFHGGRCVIIYFAPKGCTALETSSLKADVVNMYTIQQDRFEKICNQAIADSLYVPGEDVEKAILGLDSITREALERTGFSTTDEDVVLSGCSLMVDCFSACDGVLRERYVFYAAGRSDLYLFCGPEERRIELGCMEKVQMLSQKFFGGN